MKYLNIWEIFWHSTKSIRHVEKFIFQNRSIYLKLLQAHYPHQAPNCYKPITSTLLQTVTSPLPRPNSKLFQAHYPQPSPKLLQAHYPHQAPNFDKPITLAKPQTVTSHLLPPRPKLLKSITKPCPILFEAHYNTGTNRYPANSHATISSLSNKAQSCNISYSRIIKLLGCPNSIFAWPLSRDICVAF